MTKPRVLFAGTPDFALASLKALVENGVVPVAVLTQPDRPAGRGKKLTASPVKKFAQKQGLPLSQPTTLRDATVIAEMIAFEPDIMIVAAYGLILPQDVLDVPTQGCLNVHASLLPRWRGAAPIQAAILAADKSTGISLMKMTAGLDCGPVFLSEAIDIGAAETAGELHDHLAALGGRMLAENLATIVAGDMEAIEQDESLVTYAEKVTTADAALDWSQSAEEVSRKVRAYNPVPGAYFRVGEERVKCWRANAVAATTAIAGTVLSADRDGIVVACGEGSISLQEVQRPGKGRLSAQEFAAQTNPLGQVFA